MVDAMMLWAGVRLALGVAAGVTSLVWGVAVYRAGLAGVRVGAITNQLTLASICQANNGTVDEVLCGSYLAAFNKNFAAIATAVAFADGATSVNLFTLSGSEPHHSLPLPVILIITFVCTTVGVFAVTQLAGRLRRRVDNREKEKEINGMELETPRSGENKVPGVVGVKALRA